MLTLKFILLGLGLLMVVLTALSFVQTRVWWVRMFDFPRAQIAVLSFAILSGQVGLLASGVMSTPMEWILFLLLCASFFIQSWEIVRYTRLWRPQVRGIGRNERSQRRIRFAVSNVCMDNRDHERWLRVISREDPDIIVAVEVDRVWDRFLVSHLSAYPHAIRIPQDNTYGMVILSRLPLGPTSIEHLIEEDVPSVFTEALLPCGARVRVVLLHPRPPRPDIQQDSDLRDAELVLAARKVEESDSPVVIAGDLNDVAWSHTTRLFQRIARVLDPRVGRGIFPTFHADHWYLRYPLDHIFHSNHFDLVEIRRLDHVGSDHFPMLIELELRETAPPPDALDPPKPSDEEQAADAVADARERRVEETPAERLERKQADR